MTDGRRIVADTRQRFIFHITHIDNLPAIIESGGLSSDRRLLGASGDRIVIGYEEIKRRRLEELSVHCHPGTRVGDYVPFYFCPRSPMLYVIHRRNEGLSFKGGQERVVHLVSTVELAVKAAADRPFAFSDGNAGTRFTQFSKDLNQLDSLVDWSAVQAHYWSDPAVKERKQAEFLVHDTFPWPAIVAIGVINQSVEEDVKAIVGLTAHRPKIAVKPDWYY